MQQRVITPTQIQAECRTHVRMHRRGLTLDVATEYLNGLQSTNEVDFAALCRRYRIPQPVRQTRRRDSAGKWRYTDAEFVLPDGRVLIVEIDGLHHLDPENWLEDIKRQNTLMVATGGLLLRVATWTLKREPDDFMPFLKSVVEGTL
jgi:very-short-patch-repair endonuclease